ncbi:MAG TPA: PEGA domain-containing protein [Tepidisphaeraceae bacterium]|nr:PEGA domain-containing protein [Tepidisphaeraceae bacterium]
MIQRSKPFRALVTPVLAVAMLAAQGCSAFQPKFQAVTITTATPGAEIEVNGRDIGVSPVSTELQRNKSHAIIARHMGKTGTASIGTKISTTGVLDIVGTVFFIVPIIGVFTPGFHELDTTNVVVPMR